MVDDFFDDPFFTGAAPEEEEEPEEQDQGRQPAHFHFEQDDDYDPALDDYDPLANVPAAVQYLEDGLYCEEYL